MSKWGFDEKWAEKNAHRIVGASHEREEARKAEGDSQGRARGERPRGRMNKTEGRYARLLDHRPDVIDYAYETFGLRLAKGLYHYPDFLVMLDGGLVEVHEVKGGYQRRSGEDKFKMGADVLDWFVWREMVYEDGGWTQKRVRNQR